MDDLLKTLQRLKVETGSLACMGCGHENSCSTRGCAILRAAIEEIERNQPVMKNAMLLKGVRIPEQGFIEIQISSDGNVILTGESVRYDDHDYYRPVGPALIGSACCEGCKHWSYCRGKTLDPMAFCYEPGEDGDA